MTFPPQRPHRESDLPGQRVGRNLPDGGRGRSRPDGLAAGGPTSPETSMPTSPAIATTDRIDTRWNFPSRRTSSLPSRIHERTSS